MSGQQRILVVEDDPFLRKACHTSLRKRGYDVLLAPDGQEGLDAARAAMPDLILLDLLMPKVPGVDVLRALKADERTKRIPVLVLSNSSRPADREAAAALGAVGYIVKANLSLRELADCVARLLGDGGGEGSGS